MNERGNVIKKIQRMELDILKVYQEICKKHHLRYFAIGGTCIGATQYHGFIPWIFFGVRPWNIPWDDDIEIAMPYDDYQTFIALSREELPEPYFLTEPMMEMSVPLFASICNAEADCIPEYKKYSSGVRIDIHPIYGLPHAKWKQGLLLRIVSVLKRWNFILRFRDMGKGIREKKLILALLGSKPYYYFFSKINKLLDKYPFDKSEEVFFAWRRFPCETNSCYRTSYPCIFPRVIFQSSVEVSFEDTVLPVPENYDKYIEREFGHFKGLPPLGLRVSLHRRSSSYNPSYPLPRVILENDTLRRIQSIELDLLKVFQALCKKHALRYFALGGTCIGAIRHHGFIPWDDDLDVVMPYEDRQKFIEIAKKELSYPYSILSPMNCPHDPFVIRLQNEATTYDFSISGRYCSGVFMDILTLYGLPHGDWEQKCLFALLRILNCMDRNFRFNFRWPADIKRTKWEKLMSKIFGAYPFYYFTTKRENILKKFSFDNAKKCFFIYHGGQPTFLKEDFQSAIEVPFEDSIIAVPVGYDRYLRTFFGDYIELPPEEERTPKYPRYIFDLNRPYKEYFQDADAMLMNNKNYTRETSMQKGCSR